MSYWRTFEQNYLPYVPIFLLTLSCGAGSGSLMMASFLAHLIICRKEGRPIAGTLWKAPVVWQTVVTIALFLGTAALTIPFNDGRPAVLLKYVERLIPPRLGYSYGQTGEGNVSVCLVRPLSVAPVVSGVGCSLSDLAGQSLIWPFQQPQFLSQRTVGTDPRRLIWCDSLSSLLA